MAGLGLQEGDQLSPPMQGKLVLPEGVAQMAGLGLREGDQISPPTQEELIMP